MSNKTEVVCILDCGAQFAKVIDRKIRELKVKTDILHIDTPVERLTSYSAIIISGGPESVYNNNIKFDKKLFELGIPVLGICFGMQMMAFCTGGKVEKHKQREDGQFFIKVKNESPLYSNMDSNQLVLLTHGDSVIEVGKDFKVIGHSGDLITSISCEEKKLYGVQFHPEVDLTVNGKQLFSNFLFNVCQLSGNFTEEDRKEKAIQYIRNIVNDKKVLVLCSGGVDSTVCAALINEAIGPEKVIPFHIDNGFMRKQESEKVGKALEDIGLKVLSVDASETFYNGTTHLVVGGNKVETKKLIETTNPEEKRKIIGDTFMRVAQDKLSKLGLTADEVFLAQGTLRPDIIESGSLDISKVASTIKTHHNDTNLVRELRALKRIIEPLSEYHKDEVRALGRILGLPSEIVDRHPFPGPGLSVRIICTNEPFVDETFESTNSFISCVLRYPKADIEQDDLAIHGNLKREQEKDLLDVIRRADEIRGTLLPIKTVGVQGDSRTYNYVCALSSKAKPNWEQLFMLAKLIPRLCHNINRVVFVFEQLIEGPITTITPTYLTPENIQILQDADDIVTDAMMKRKAMHLTSQVPVILVPVTFGTGTHSIAIRTIITNDFMTGHAAVPGKDIPEEMLIEMVQRIKELPTISAVFYDLTSKPPGTTEWE